MKKKIIIIISILVIALGAYLAGRAIFGGDQSAYSIVPVSRGEVAQVVSVTGTVISAKQIDLQFESSGKIDQVNVRVGEEVKAGQVLIKLDSSELYAQLQANQAALDITQAKLNQTLAGTRPEEIQVYQAAVDKAEIEVENKKLALADVQEDADNDLGVAYEDALDTVKSSYTVADQALTVTFAGVRQNYFNGSSQLALNVKDKESSSAKPKLLCHGMVMGIGSGDGKLIFI